MTERPILFSAPMVRALLAGTKTQTRRGVKPMPPPPVQGVYRPFPSEPNNWQGYGRDSLIHWYGRCPYGVPGDVLWVKETYRLPRDADNLKPSAVMNCESSVLYVADGEPEERYWGKTRVSIHMPRWASRISLTITDVRVERLNDISEEDCLAEGIQRLPEPSHSLVWRGAGDPRSPGLIPHYVAEYRALWDHINGVDSWDANPWVWAVSFEVQPSAQGALCSEPNDLARERP